jgi:branched-chain amino acid transport system substrate-binding protein
MHVVSRYRRNLIAAGALLPMLALAACGSGASSSSASSAATGPGSTSSGSASSASTGGSYKVVLISDLSGPFSAVSGPGAAGAEVAVDNINATGGVNGKQLELQTIDSQSTATGAQAAAQKAVSENPQAIMMFSGSAGASSITSLVQSAHIPFLSPALADTSVYPPQPDLYQSSLTAKQDAEAMYDFVKAQVSGGLAGKTVDIAAINSPYVDVIINDARTSLVAAGAKIANVERYDLPLASFAAQAGTIARDNPAVVLILGATDDSVVVSKALTAAGVHALQVGIPSGAAQVTIQQAHTAKYYAMTANPYPSALSSLLAIAAKYGKASDVSGSIFSMSGWVTAYVLAQALKQCGGNCSGANLNSALEQVSNYTVPDGASYGPVTFSATNHIAANTVRFHSFNPATGKFSESSPFTVQ